MSKDNKVGHISPPKTDNQKPSPARSIIAGGIAGAIEAAVTVLSSKQTTNLSIPPNSQKPVSNSTVPSPML
jgi:hypothetical protein